MYNYRIDAQSVFVMENIRDELEQTLQMKPSQTVLIRRALRFYGEHVQSLPQTVGAWETERNQLRLAAGRKGRTQ